MSVAQVCTIWAFVCEGKNTWSRESVESWARDCSLMSLTQSPHSLHISFLYLLHSVYYSHLSSQYQTTQRKSKIRIEIHKKGNYNFTFINQLHPQFFFLSPFWCVWYHLHQYITSHRNKMRTIPDATSTGGWRGRGGRGRGISWLSWLQWRPSLTLKIR